MTELTTAELSTLIDTNLGSTFHICQLAYPLLKASGLASVVFISSVSGFVNLQSMSVQGATKGWTSVVRRPVTVPALSSVISLSVRQTSPSRRRVCVVSAVSTSLPRLRRFLHVASFPQFCRVSFISAVLPLLGPPKSQDRKVKPVRCLQGFNCLQPPCLWPPGCCSRSHLHSIGLVTCLRIHCRLSSITLRPSPSVRVPLFSISSSTKMPLQKSSDSPLQAKSAAPVSKEDLGRATWTFLHTLAAQYPDNPTRQQKKDVKDLIHILTRLYPCKECADHFKEVIRANPVQAGSHTEFSQWLCHVHNVVNRR
ncbi:hypothetical protein PIB30_014071 [Stylosanthes scabra]|uniref:Sulfhydryl oxidase n=1 Tax=Stylosanthes scabra TaxID=79078 RepID=A0ABU6R6S8_9FABA|nr:hypothetical protein [Stylosanthes scabra]